MITEIIGKLIAHRLAPTFAKNISDGIAEFNKHCFPMPVRCRARHWMGRGKERVDMGGLIEA